MFLTDRIWIDVEDLFQYAFLSPRPSGIQRVQYELCRALAALDPSGTRVRFVRHDRAAQVFYPIDYKAIDRLFNGLAIGGPPRHAAAGPPPDAARTERAVLGASGRNLLKRLVYRLPLTVRQPLIRALFHGRQTALAGWDVARALIAGLRKKARKRRLDDDGPSATGSFDAGPADILVALGSPWFYPDYDTIIARAKDRHGLRFGLLVHDIIPLRRPEFCDAGLTQAFGAWFRATLPLADVVISISHWTAEDLRRYAADTGLGLRCTPSPIPAGTGFARMSVALAAAPSTRLPPKGSYCAVVGTLEARKNHVLLLRVWRRLLDEMPIGSVPTLLFAGRVGWLVADLMAQLRNTRFLDGRIVLIEDATDMELEQIYDECLFTLFPSFCEGWGLPVTESLAAGCPCLASCATSIPEAGGDLARYFDPDDATQAYRLIREAIEDVQGTHAWRGRIAQSFRRVGWDVSAHAVMDVCGVPRADPEPKNTTKQTIEGVLP